MTGTNSSNDRLTLRQNVEINSNEYFVATYFFGNEIVDHVVWRRHCAITKKKCINLQSYFNDLLCFYRTIIGVNFHVFIICYCWSRHFPFFLKKLSVITKVLFLVRCAVVLLPAQWPGWSTQISRHRSSDWDNIGLSCRLNRLNKHSRWDEWQDKVSFCLLIRFNWRVPARVPLFSLGL